MPASWSGKRAPRLEHIHQKLVYRVIEPPNLMLTSAGHL
jgi:hypothetical protein